MEVVQEAEDKDVKAIDEYLENPALSTLSMVKSTPLGEKGVEVIPHPVTPIKMVMADSSTPLSKEGVGVIPPPVTPVDTVVVYELVTPISEEGADLFSLPVTQSEELVAELETAVAEPQIGSTKYSGIGFLKLSIPLTWVKVPIRPTEVTGILDLYYQELKEGRKQEERRRAKTKKSMLRNPSRRLTIDHYYSSIPDNEPIAKAVGTRLPNLVIVSSTLNKIDMLALAAEQQTAVPTNAETASCITSDITCLKLLSRR